MSHSSAGRVLIVDADAPIRGLLSAIVQRISHTPVVAATGEQALELLARQNFEAIILDLLLPGVSGHQILSWLAESAPELLENAIVLTTGKPSRAGELARAAAVLRKPFAIDELLAALAICCVPKQSGDRPIESDRPPEDPRTR